MSQGRIRRIPLEVDTFINNLRSSEQIPNLKQTFIKLKDYAIIGKEVNRIGKGLGIKVVK